jgi:hypothetical protein
MTASASQLDVPAFRDGGGHLRFQLLSRRLFLASDTNRYINRRAERQFTETKQSRDTRDMEGA